MFGLGLSLTKALSTLNGIIRDGLKMWLPFSKSEILGEELVVNGDFATTIGWITESGWSIGGDVASKTDTGTYTAIQQNILTSGKTYSVTFDITSVTSGSIFGIRLGTNYILRGNSQVGTYTGVGEANGTTLSVMSSQDFEGSIDNISVKEVVSPTLNNLKGYWHLSEGDGAINYDSSGEGNDGAINGATWEDQQATIPQLGLMDWSKPTIGSDEITLIADPNDPSDDILGNSVRLREHSLNLDGSGYAEVPDADNLDFGTGDFSYGFWFKVESGDLGFLFGVSNLGNPSGVALTMDVATGKIRSRPFGVAATYTTSGYNDGDWHYAFHNIDRSDSAKLFIDNTEVLSQDISSESSTSLATTNWYVGVENGTGTFLNGLIDDVTIYNRALSSDEVEQNYKAGLNKHKTGSSFSDDFSSDYGF